MATLVCLSDTHNKLSQIDVPEGDILVHAGDWSGAGTPNELFKFRTQIKYLPHKHKIVIAGNHDWIAERNPTYTKEAFEELGITYLFDEAIEVEGLKFYGSPWQPRFFNWAFNLDRGNQLKEKWDAIPENTDVLITHGPPHGVLDVTPRGEAVGCVDLWHRIQELPNLKAHIFGHIHGSYGKAKIGNTLFVNASNLTEAYQPNYKPIVIEV